MPEVKFFEMIVKDIETCMADSATRFSKVVGKNTIVSIIALTSARIAEAASTAALSAANF